MKKNISFKNRLGRSLAGVLHTPKRSNIVGCVFYFCVRKILSPLA